MEIKKSESFVAKAAVNIIATVVYAFGLSVIIPLALMALFPERVWSAVVYAKPVIFLAIGLVFLSALVLFMYTKSLGKTFFHLGVTTLVPGVLAFVFSFFSRDLVFGFVEKYVAPFAIVEPYIKSYLSLLLPRVLALTLVYFALSFVLLFFGVRQLRRESTVSLVKKVFGSSAHVYR
jgi:hypothetical protein